jgi:hypothetical protein
VVAQVLDKPVLVESESSSKGQCLIELRVMGRSL